jgi:hypothetical protein
MAEGEEEEEYLYINLQANPERYTGYQVLYWILALLACYRDNVVGRCSLG